MDYEYKSAVVGYAIILLGEGCFYKFQSSRLCFIFYEKHLYARINHLISWIEKQGFYCKITLIKKSSQVPSYKKKESYGHNKEYSILV